MSFKITIKNISEKDLGPFLARMKLPKSATRDVVYEDDFLDQVFGKGAKNKNNGKKYHSRADSLLTMTGKEPSSKSQLAKARIQFEKLEKKMGIGSVTVADFRKHLVSKQMSKQLAQRCVTEKVLAYL